MRALLMIVHRARSRWPRRPPRRRSPSQDLLDGLKDPTRWLTYSRRLQRPAAQPAHADHAGERQPAGGAVDVPDRHARQLPDDAARASTACSTSPASTTTRGRSTRGSGRQIWRYRRELPEDLTLCCGAVNRGFGVLGDRLFMATLDAHLLALDMKTGAVVWDVELDGLQDRATPRPSRRSSSRTR